MKEYVSPTFRILLKMEACKSMVKNAQVNKNIPKICRPIPKFVEVGMFNFMFVRLKTSPRKKPSIIKVINFSVS